MELYAEYIKEREGIEIIVKDYGFCTYKIMTDDIIYLADIYIKKDKRRNKLTTPLVDEVAQIGRDSGCRLMMGSFCIDTNNWKAGKSLVKSLGFKYYEKQKKTNMIYVIKEI